MEEYGTDIRFSGVVCACLVGSLQTGRRLGMGFDMYVQWCWAVEMAP